MVLLRRVVALNFFTPLVKFIERCYAGIRKLLKIVMVILAILGIAISIAAFGFAIQSVAFGMASIQQVAHTYIFQTPILLNLYLGYALYAIAIIFFIFALMRQFVKYDIKYELVSGDSYKISFSLSLIKKILLLNIPIELKEIKAQVRYLAGDNTWPVDAHWKYVGTWLYVREPVSEEIKFVHRDGDSWYRINDQSQKLSDNLKIQIDLVNRNGKIVSSYKIS